MKKSILCLIIIIGLTCTLFLIGNKGENVKGKNLIHESDLLEENTKNNNVESYSNVSNVTKNNTQEVNYNNENLTIISNNEQNKTLVSQNEVIISESNSFISNESKNEKDIVTIPKVENPEISKDSSSSHNQNYEITENLNNPVNKIPNTIYNEIIKDQTDKLIKIDTIDNQNKSIILVDKSNNAACAQAIEYFYEDSNYKYYFTCVLSHRMYVIVNGIEYKLVTALENGIVTISELEANGYHFNKTAKLIK